MSRGPGPFTKEEVRMLDRITALETTNEKLQAAVPRSWDDPLLAGPDEIIGKEPFNHSDISKLLNAIRFKMSEIIRKSQHLSEAPLAPAEAPAPDTVVASFLGRQDE